MDESFKPRLKKDTLKLPSAEMLQDATPVQKFLIDSALKGLIKQDDIIDELNIQSRDIHETKQQALLTNGKVRKHSEAIAVIERERQAEKLVIETASRKWDFLRDPLKEAGAFSLKCVAVGMIYLFFKYAPQVFTVGHRVLTGGGDL